MKLHRFFKSYCLSLTLLGAVGTIIATLHRDYLIAIAILIYIFIAHVCYDYHKNKINHYENEEDNSEDSSQMG